jgi:hypothetical protein
MTDNNDFENQLRNLEFNAGISTNDALDKFEEIGTRLFKQYRGDKEKLSRLKPVFDKQRDFLTLVWVKGQIRFDPLTHVNATIIS